MPFLAIEGGDGTGKGTLVAALIPTLRDAGHDVLATSEPGGTPAGLALRALLLPQDAVWSPWAELLLMAAARVQHADHVIRPALQAGRVVVTDRFVGSTLAYQGAGRGLPLADITALHMASTGNLQPDLTIVLDLAPETGLRRSRARLAASGADEGRFESLDLPFHARVRESFLTQAAQRPASHIVVDASQPATLVHSVVAKAVLTWLEGRVAPQPKT